MWQVSTMLDGTWGGQLRKKDHQTDLELSKTSTGHRPFTRRRVHPLMPESKLEVVSGFSVLQSQ